MNNHKDKAKTILKNIKKIWIIIPIILIMLRIILSCKLPSFFLGNLHFDDRLMINNSTYILEGKYLANYCDLTLIKRIIYPIFLSGVRLINMPYSVVLTMLYILASLFFTNSIKKIIKRKSISICIFALLLFNPITYSSDAFQRLYRNSLAYTELLFFLGIIIRIINKKKENVFSYIFLGIAMSVMLLTKEDNIWAYAVLIIVILYKLYKNKKIKNVIIGFIPITIIIINLNIVSYMNYTKYGIYTYDELHDSAFEKAYIKILQIKDDEKIDNVAITKSTLYKLAENSKIFDFTKTQIDNRYKMVLKQDETEITNGNMVWYLRSWIYQKNYFKDGKEANEYYQKLSDEIDELFKQGKLEKEFVIPSVNINTPTINEIKNFPKNLIKTIWYTSSYKNVKTFSEEDLEKEYNYDERVNAYLITYLDYHNAENIIDNNPMIYEIIRNVYKYFTIILSLVALLIYIKNIKKRDKLNLVIHIIFLAYLIIILGVTYTHTTAFDAMRYCYLTNVYILQSLFILLNLHRMFSGTLEKNRFDFFFAFRNHFRISLYRKN